MKSRFLPALLVFAALIRIARANPSDSPGYISPSGRLEVADIHSDGDLWIVSEDGSFSPVKLPKPSGDAEPDDEFHISPNDEWILALRHVGSGMRDADLYHRINPATIELVKSFNDAAWNAAVKLGALKENYSAAGLCEMTFFTCWSSDSTRLLIELSGGEERSAMKSGQLYFNLRTDKFEITEYLCKLNRSNSEPVGCAEPLGPLPGEAELKARFDALDEQLNKAYRKKIALLDKDGVSELRESQRDWIKNRDAGLAIYLASFPAAEKESRRLQFLGDVTAARIDFLRPVAE